MMIMFLSRRDLCFVGLKTVNCGRHPFLLLLLTVESDSCCGAMVVVTRASRMVQRAEAQARLLPVACRRGFGGLGGV